MQVSDRNSEVPAPVRRLRADDARRVADILRQQIHTGAFAETLPGEQALAAEHQASRNTVREALALLQDEGLIARAPRVGTKVTARKFDHGLDTLLGLQETFEGHGVVRNEVRAATRISAPPAVARRLALEPGTRVVYIERLRYLGDLPLSLDLTYLAPGVGAAVLEHDLERTDIFVLLEQISGQSLGSADLAVEALCADPHTAATLDIPAGAALLMLERLTRLDDGTPVDLEYVRLRGDRITLRGSLSRSIPEWKVL
ncbi:GntR family transcriptional regulator [Nocardia cyriacigeorgica]|uniref:GntR family transcriptional regulator n=1 Tax=Nocardia cyriacigeorgica TaxID=135487 RepID=UPI001894409E|nr:GntR family transcriptional regulator [Nocardia cyriacigeorgica]MBF6089837.1 GntR family transcriptional regulator [Nocardia cyriacigeorgica]MBF6095082.1 GntR family transcriptional regulator [Nocardia cyriacigeorgica]MBF6399012.1 GntR family transcriptional regulator [Nocardia cyriacigeorgica]MBF6404643.1 GntR family transcriptional regulator [Nocardia cyriacigeorgica]